MIDNIYRIGDDALASEYDMIIAPVPGVFQEEDLKIRTMTFSHPEISAGFYTIDYKGEHIEKPNYDNATAKEFSISFRVDKNFNYYKKMLAWLWAIRDPEGNVTNDVLPVGATSPLRSPIVEVRAVNSSNDFLKMTWKYTNVIIKSLSAIGHDNASQDPLMADVTFSYLKFDYSET